MRTDFSVSKFYTYSGPNHYLNRQAFVFNLYMDSRGYSVDHYQEAVARYFPALAEKIPDRVVNLFAEVVIQLFKMDIDLFVNRFSTRFSIGDDGDEYVIAVEYLDSQVAEEAVILASEWFQALNDGNDAFGFAEKFQALQQKFDRTLFGGPTIYSLIEAGLKRDIPVHFLYEENQFQWGYGKKQLRGRSTTFHVDGIKDTEFTMYKDMVGEFLGTCGFPTPIGKKCFTVDEIVDEADKLGYPVVVKPVAGHKGQGVTTGIDSAQGVENAFLSIKKGAEAAGVHFEGALVQKQIYGTDHRLLAVGGKFAVALERIPAYVDGNGKDSIKALIAAENAKAVRLDNARSPLCKIHIDDDLADNLRKQKHDLLSIPEQGERIVLRRVANISAGGVSINVTDKIHPKNVQIMMRNPQLDFALINHTKDDVLDYGFYHQGCDIAVFIDADSVTRSIKTNTTTDAIIIEVFTHADTGREAATAMMPEIIISQNGKELMREKLAETVELHSVVIDTVKPYIKALVNKY